jgi:endonuclease/exonuclease/phosphatase family metal-dependent hydrolase
VFSVPLWFLLFSLTGCLDQPQPVLSGGGDAGDYLFCFWNVENLFDDKDDNRRRPDKDFDEWFAQNPKVRREKYDHLSQALVEMNDGKGPDILAVAEVESARAAELLAEALNARLKDPSLHYGPPIVKEVAGGRHICTAILTRLPAERDKTQLLGRRLRILEGHLEVNGHELVILATHWTSRVSDEEGEGRDKYADICFGRYRGMHTGNPQVDLLICGDFNDTPDDDSVKDHLHATGDRAAVRRDGHPPLLLDLMAGKDPEQFGTHNYRNKWFIFDHIVVSPGMLDAHGWSCDPDSVKTVNSLARPGDRQRRPWRFGTEHDKFERGYSDHFPVTVRLRVEGS